MSGRSSTTIFLIVVSLLTAWPQPASRAETPLPAGEVLARHAAAMGGEQRLFGFRSLHIVGSITITGFAGAGSRESWFERPCRAREEIVLGPLRITAGMDEGIGWVRDANGQVTLRKDPTSVREALADCFVARYEYLEPNAAEIQVEGPRAIAVLDGRECYVVRIGGQERELYIDPETWRLAGVLGSEEGLQSISIFSDYRDVQGIQVPFSEETRVPQVGQTIRTTVSSVEFNEPMADTLFSVPYAQIHDFSLEGGRPFVTVPVEVRDGLLFLQVAVGQDEPRRFLLDSGAGKTVLDSSYAAALGLDMQAALPGVGAGEVSAVRLVTIPPLSLAGVHVDEQSGAALPLREWTEWLGGLEISGVLGFDFLSRFVTRIDYVRGEITFWDPSAFSLPANVQRFEPVAETDRAPSDPDRSVVVPAPLMMNVFTLPVRVNGGEPTTFILDTGAQATVLGGGLAAKRGLLDQEGTRTIARGVGGTEHFRLVQLETLEVAGFVVQAPKAALRLRQGGALQILLDAVSGPDGGILGGNVLQDFVVTLDYGNQQVVFERQRAAGPAELPARPDEGGTDDGE